MPLAQIRDRGQLTIPRSIRKKIGLTDNSVVTVTAKQGKIIIEPVAVIPTRDYTQKEIEQFIKEDKLGK